MTIGAFCSIEQLSNLTGDWVNSKPSKGLCGNPFRFMFSEHQRIYFCQNLSGPVPLKFVPKFCSLSQKNVVALLTEWRGRTISFVGDSLSRQHYDNVLCEVDQYAQVTLIDFYHAFIAANNINITFQWSPWLFEFVDNRKVHGSAVSNQLRFSRLDWIPPVGDGVVILNTGHWYSEYTLREYGIAGDHEAVFDEAYFSLFRSLSSYHNPVIFRSTSPGHPNCGSMGAQAYNPGWNWSPVRRNDLVRMTFPIRPCHYYLDIYSLSMERFDGHPSSFNEGNDCLHWCNPSPTSVINTWTEALFSLLLQIPVSCLQNRSSAIIPDA